MRRLALRIGLYRVAALLIACALLLEVLRVQVLRSGRATAVLTLGEVLFLALAASVFVIARRRSRHPGMRH
jgi:hypothetical protein